VSRDPERLRRALDLPGFGEPALLDEALTHSSAGMPNYERLEFLGDAMVGLVVAEALWRRCPDATEGDLSRRRAALVKRESLASLARQLELGEYLRLGTGELRSGGHARDSTLADAFEALIGAVYVDQGFAAARELILRLFAERIAQVAARSAMKDPKTRLQELLQARRLELPEYEVVEIIGEQHAQRFVVRCRLPDLGHETRADGTSRRRAEQQAAELMLDELAA
jgi:ribonuclease III